MHFSHNCGTFVTRDLSWPQLQNVFGHAHRGPLLTGKGHPNCTPSKVFLSSIGVLHRDPWSRMFHLISVQLVFYKGLLCTSDWCRDGSPVHKTLASCHLTVVGLFCICCLSAPEWMLLHLSAFCLQARSVLGWELAVSMGKGATAYRMSSDFRENGKHNFVICMYLGSKKPGKETIIFLNLNLCTGIADPVWPWP